MSGNQSERGIQFGQKRHLAPEIREQRRASMIEEIKHMVENSVGTVPPLNTRPQVLPQLQQSNDTCLIACLVGIKKAHARSSGSAYLVTENDLANRARNAGVLRNGGIMANIQTQTFIREQLNLEAEIVASDPIDKTTKLLNALRRSEFPILDYSLGGSIGHWSVIVDIAEISQKPHVIFMNPLKGIFYEALNSAEFANRIMGDELTDKPNPYSSTLLVVTQQLGFRVTDRRKGD